MTEYIYSQDNEIHLLGNVKETSYEILYGLFYFAGKSCKSTIDLHISSPGGDLSSLYNLISLIRSSNKPITIHIHNTIAYGIYTGVASAASVLTTYCDKIVIDKNATFLIHHARSHCSDGKISKIYEDEEDIFFWMEKTSQPYDIIESLIKGENTLDAESAINLGFVHAINYNTSAYKIPDGEMINISSFNKLATHRANPSVI